MLIPSWVGVGVAIEAENRQPVRAINAAALYILSRLIQQEPKVAVTLEMVMEEYIQSRRDDLSLLCLYGHPLEVAVVYRRPRHSVAVASHDRVMRDALAVGRRVS